MAQIDQQTLSAISGQQAAQGMAGLGQAISKAAAFREEQKNNEKVNQMRDLQMAGQQLTQQKTQLDIELAIEEKNEWLQQKGLRAAQAEEQMAATKDKARDRRVGNVLTATSDKDSRAYLNAMVNKGDISPETKTNLDAMSFKERKDFMSKNEFWYDKSFQQTLWLQQEKDKTAVKKTKDMKPHFESTASSAETISAKIDQLPRESMSDDYEDAIDDEGMRVLASASRGFLDQYKDLGVTQDELDTALVNEYKRQYDIGNKNKVFGEPTINVESVKDNVRKQLEAVSNKMSGTNQGVETLTGQVGGSEEVTKYIKGRAAIFNSKTKEFIRWVD